MPLLGKKSTNDFVNKIGRKSGIPSYSFGSKMNAGKKLTTNMTNIFEGGNKIKSELER